MAYMKKLILTIAILSLLFLLTKSAFSQSTTEIPEDEFPEAAKEAKTVGFFFKKDEFKEKQRQERRELIKKQREEKRALIEKHRQETKEKKQQQQLKTKEKEKVKSKIKEEEEKISKTRKTEKLVQVVTSENDPLYILDAEVRKAKSAFLKIRDLDLKYTVRVKNQTPKIINVVSVVWQRSVPLEPTKLVTLETKTSKPIVPYEERIIQYNDLDPERQAETYKVKIKTVVFEDGSQWINPS